MRYCRRCVQPDTRPGILFHEDGVCAACRFHEQSGEIDWSAREAELKEIAEWAKARSGGGFDCVIGVSGGKDSTFQALYVRDELGLKALLVNAAPDGITEVGRQNLDNLVQQGFDMVSYRPNPKVMRAVVKRAFYEYGNPVKPTEYPLFAVSFQTSLKFGIPLVVLGENIAIVGGVVSSLAPDGDAVNIRRHNTLAGGNASDWTSDGIGPSDLQFYQFPDEEELRQNVRAIWLGYYVKKWSYSHNTEFAVEHGLRGRENHDAERTGRLSPYLAIDDDMQILNQMLKYYKFGYGLVTGEACNLIKEGRISRDDAIQLVEKYDGKCDERYIRDFCENIGISGDEFWRVVDGLVNKELFQRDAATGEWKPRFKVGTEFVTEH